MYTHRNIAVDDVGGVLRFSDTDDFHPSLLHVVTLSIYRKRTRFDVELESH